MSALRSRRELAQAAWRTWGLRGLARRLAYEASKRAGRVRTSEDRWLVGHTGRPQPLRAVGIAPPPEMVHQDPTESERSEPTLALYGGGVVVDLDDPILWHRHPLTGHEHDPAAHWSTISDASPEQGDIKDIWDRSRFGWLTADLRRWAATGDDAVAERIWTVIEDWHRSNPPYRGPNWMCGQETSLRAINLMLLADALRASPASTTDRQVLAASMVRDAVGRVRPTLGYALSQRNNHAISEAGFLWTASLLAPDLPEAAAIQAAAAGALTEAVADQFATDGSYAQHSPTYHRLAVHVLLWVLAVSRATGEAPPPGVADVVRRSVGFLTALVAPESDGQVPNLGGNDGALLHDLTGSPIGDMRPVIAHAAAATGQRFSLGPGRWDDEARWFGLEPTPERRRGSAPVGPSTNIDIHPLTVGGMHAVLRAGPLRHRPAHADQLHVDVWIDGEPVAVDAGSYRYTAPEPWGNALAGEETHNVPRRAGSPQATLAGRFFWRSWQEASVEGSHRSESWMARVVSLTLDDQTVLRRLVAVSDDLVVVVDRASAPVSVRWNLTPGSVVRPSSDLTAVSGPSWRASFVHDDRATLPDPTPDDPTSGWQAPRYGELVPVEVVVLPVLGGSASAVFGRSDGPVELAALAGRLGDLDLTSPPDQLTAALDVMVEVSAAGER